MSHDVALFWDYIVLGFCVFLNSSVVLYMKFFGPKQKTKKDYVFASDTISIPAMILSITRGTLGIRAFLGYPAELFYKGSGMWEIIYGMILAYVVVCFIFAPVYISLGITSIYQYLDLRFKSYLVRCLASGTYIIRQLLLLSITIYTPSVALKTILGIPQWVSIVTLTSVGISFALLGGFQAAIYADVVQVLMMIGMSFAITIKGTWQAGGVETVFERNVDGKRLNFLNFDADPTARVTTISATFGQLFISLSTYGCTQNFVQRYFSIKSRSKLTKTLLFTVPVTIVLFSLTWIVGMTIYANYYDCDPASAGYIKKYDEILPFFIEDKFHYLPGVLGLFLACLFNGALCLNASNLNSLSTVIFEDFIKKRVNSLTEIQQIQAIKGVSVVCGLLVMGISFTVGMLSGIIETSVTFSSATSGPLLGVFILAMLVPCCNWKGAASGMILGHLLCLWIVAGSLTIEKSSYTLSLTTDGCNNSTFNPHVTKINERSMIEDNYTQISNVIVEHNPNALHYIYSITFMYYAVIGFTITVVSGTLISLCTQYKEKDVCDVKLLHPLVRKIAIYFQEKVPSSNVI